MGDKITGSSAIHDCMMFLELTFRIDPSAPETLEQTACALADFAFDIGLRVKATAGVLSAVMVCDALAAAVPTVLSIHRAAMPGTHTTYECLCVVLRHQWPPW